MHLTGPIEQIYTHNEMSYVFNLGLITPLDTSLPNVDCMSSRIWIHTVCLYALLALICNRLLKLTTFSDAIFAGALRVNLDL